MGVRTLGALSRASSSGRGQGDVGQLSWATSVTSALGPTDLAPLFRTLRDPPWGLNREGSPGRGSRRSALPEAAPAGGLPSALPPPPGCLPGFSRGSRPQPIHISVHVSPPHEAALGPELNAVTCLRASAHSFPSRTLADITGFLTRCSVSPCPLLAPRAGAPWGALRVPCSPTCPIHAAGHGATPSLPPQLRGATSVPRVHNHCPAWTPGRRCLRQLAESGALGRAHGFLGCTEASLLAPTPLLEGGLGRGEQDTQRPGSCSWPRGGWARQGAATGPGRVWLGLPVGWPAPSWGLRGVLRAEAKRGPPALPASGSPRLAG